MLPQEREQLVQALAQLPVDEWEQLCEALLLAGERRGYDITVVPGQDGSAVAMARPRAA